MPIEFATCSYKEFQPGMGIPVRASVGHPRWRLPYSLIHALPALYPNPHTIRWTDRPRFTHDYWTKLVAAGVDHIRDAAEEIAARAAEEEVSGPLVVLCFEQLAKPGEWCHRSLFATFWTQQTGELVPELGGLPSGPVSPATPPTSDQETLF